MIPEKTVEEIFNKSDIVDVIGDFVKLKKRGANYLGLCPFHNEKTGSFTVSPAKQIYKCFGCGKSGNVVTFLMEHEKYDYPAALKWIANKYSITVEEEYRGNTVAPPQAAEGLYALNRFAQAYFTEQLGNAGSFLHERCISHETAEKFLLGYSEGKYFTRQALQQQFSEEILLKSGLSFQRDNELRDTYRQRIIFPVHNHYGKIVGFAARLIHKSDREPKYINSPENEVFNKGKTLYGLYFAKQAIVKTGYAIIIEGHIDLISMHQAGVEQSVATGGTALTVDQVRLLHKWTKKLIFLFDGDGAGLKAAARGVEIVLDEKMDVDIVLLPPGDDPDTYVKSGRDLLAYIQEKKVDAIQFVCEYLFDGHNQSDVGKELARIIAKLNGPEEFIRRQEYIKTAAKLLKIDEAGLLLMVTSLLKGSDDQQYNDNTYAPPAEIFDQHFKMEGNILHFLMLHATEIVYPDDNVKVADVFIHELQSWPWTNADCAELWKMYEENYFMEIFEPAVLEQTCRPYYLIMHAFKSDEEFMAGMNEGIQAEIMSLISLEREVQTRIAHFKLNKIKLMLEENSNSMEKLCGEDLHKAILVHQHLKREQIQLASRFGIYFLK